ncbi:MAG: YceI family protein [Burkholderiales bacterium]|jgi:polyisoprenoid-binding protein YceI
MYSKSLQTAVQVSLLLTSLWLAPSTVLAEPVTYTVDSKHSYASFEINHLGLSTVRGRFDRTSGTIVLDKATGSGSIEVSIDSASIDTGLAKRDEHLRRKEFFDVEQYPTISFVARALSFDGEKLTRAEGDLTMLGRTHPVSLEITHFACAQHPIYHVPACGADARTLIRRSDWGMTTYVPSIGDEVTILINVEALKLQ